MATEANCFGAPPRFQGPEPRAPRVPGSEPDLGPGPTVTSPERRRSDVDEGRGPSASPCSSLSSGAPSPSSTSTNDASDGAGGFGRASETGSTGGVASPEPPHDAAPLERQTLELIARLSRKLKILAEERALVGAEIKANEELGETILALLNAHSPELKERYRRHVEEAARIVNLFALIDSQLKRVEQSLRDSSKDKTALLERRDRLMQQLGDAETLRLDVQKRGLQIEARLKEALSAEQFTEYMYYIETKTKLIADYREIDDNLQMGEEKKRKLELSLQHRHNGAS